MTPGMTYQYQPADSTDQYELTVRPSTVGTFMDLTFNGQPLCSVTLMPDIPGGTAVYRSDGRLMGRIISSKDSAVVFSDVMHLLAGYYNHVMEHG